MELLFTFVQMLCLALYNAVVMEDSPFQGSRDWSSHLLEVSSVLSVKYKNGTWRVGQIPFRYHELFEKLVILLCV